MPAQNYHSNLIIPCALRFCNHITLRKSFSTTIHIYQWIFACFPRNIDTANCLHVVTYLINFSDSVISRCESERSRKHTYNLLEVVYMIWNLICVVRIYKFRFRYSISYLYIVMFNTSLSKQIMFNVLTSYYLEYGAECIKNFT